jgi:hypothetical protein
MSLSSRILPSARRGRVALSAFAGCCVVCGLAVAVPADAASTGPVPIVDCVATSAANGLVSAYFGYVNSGSGTTIDVGDGNEVIPGDQYEGQPTDLLAGSYPSVFEITFDPVIAPSVSWILNGQLATASTASPQCDPGTTTPASGVTDTAATLNGVVNPNGTDVTYSFEYGITPTFGSSTAVTDAGAGGTATVVQAALTDLTPATTYYYRLDTTTTYPGAGQVTVDGTQQQYTTEATAAPAPTVTVTAPGPTVTVTQTPAPAPTVTVTATPTPTPGLTLNTTSLPSGDAGASYLATLSASGGTQPYTWQVTHGSLPSGLRLNGGTGVLSGRPWTPGTYHVTITATDSTVPARESLSEQYTIKITR